MSAGLSGGCLIISPDRFCTGKTAYRFFFFGKPCGHLLLQHLFGLRPRQFRNYRSNDVHSPAKQRFVDDCLTGFGSTKPAGQNSSQSVIRNDVRNSIRTQNEGIGAVVTISVRRVWFSLSEGYPYQSLFNRVLGNLQQWVLLPTGPPALMSSA